MRQLIAGNWKMHGLTAEAESIVGPLRHAGVLERDLLVCPPATQIAATVRMLAGSGVGVGGQDCHAATHGAHTGDISAPMLRDAGAQYVILGHSERRQDHGETDPQIRAKTQAAQAAGLRPIVCVGETDAERQVDRAFAVVGAQLLGSLPDSFTGGAFDGIVAYEPIWAIGTGRTATEADVAAMHLFIRSELTRRFGAAGQATLILYGGSVRPTNAAALLAVPHVGGALVGGASLKAEDFLAIARAK